jgi:hypothetical protein
MGFLMKKTHPLFNPLYSQRAGCALVCLAVRKSYSVTPLHRRNHKESTGVDLNLHSIGVLPLPERPALRCCGAL